MLVGRESELSLLAERIELRQAVAVLGEAGVGKTALIRAAAERTGRGLYEAGALATLSWLPYLPLKRAFGREFAEGDAAYVAGEVEREVGDALLFLDDLHWADAQTRGLLSLLAGRIALVAAIRRGDPATAAALETTAAAGLELLPLEPLPASEAVDLARRLHPELSQAATERLVSRSGGNPFLLEQLAASGEPSESLRLALGARLRLLTPSGREAIGLLALLGRPAAVELIGAGSAELVAAGLASANGEVRIRHALISEATVEELEPEEGRRLHSRIAAALSDLGESARHHAAAGEQALAHEKALLAAERAATPGERAAHLGVAAANIEGTRRASLRLEAARALVAIGEYQDALDLVESLHPTGADLGAEAALLRSQSLDGLVRVDDARRELAAAVAADTKDLSLRVRIGAQRVQLEQREGRFEEMLAIAEDAVRFAESAGFEGPEVAQLFSALGYARRFLGAPGAIEAQQHALAIARRTGAGELEFGPLSSLAFGSLLEGDPAAADELALEAIERAHALRLLAREQQFRSWHAGFAWHLGDPALAATEAADVLEDAAAPATRELAEFYWWQAMTDLGQGEAVRPFVESRVANAPPDEDGVGDALWALADIELAAGRPHAAERAAAAYFERFGRAWPFVAVTRAWAQLEHDAFPETLGRTPLRLAEAGPIEVEALVALAQRDYHGAASAFDRAADLWEGRHVRGAVRCRWAAAESLRRAEQLDSARERLILIEPEAERRQLNVLLRKIRRSLRLAGVHRAAERTKVGSLTGRELEVLELVAEGLTNDEIARRLGLGRPTVVRLIDTASRKLGAKTRAQAAVLARR